MSVELTLTRSIRSLVAVRAAGAARNADASNASPTRNASAETIRRMEPLLSRLFAIRRMP